MKIKKINTHLYSSKYGNKKVFGQPLKVRSGVILEIISDQNIKGYGECYQASYIPEVTKVVIDNLKINLIGVKITNIHDAMGLLRIPFVTDKGFVKGVMSAFEIALWDLKAKTLKKPLYKILNPKNKRKNIECYASGGSVIFGKKEIQKDIDFIKKHNHKSYKMRIGYFDWAKDLTRLNYARSKLKGFNLMVDAIMGTLNTWNYNNSKTKLADLKK